MKSMMFDARGRCIFISINRCGLVNALLDPSSVTTEELSDVSVAVGEVVVLRLGFTGETEQITAPSSLFTRF